MILRFDSLQTRSQEGGVQGGPLLKIQLLLLALLVQLIAAAVAAVAVAVAVAAVVVSSPTILVCRLMSLTVGLH